MKFTADRPLADPENAAEEVTRDAADALARRARTR